MPKFAQYDHTVTGPTLVIGWYDTDDNVYAALPSMQDLLSLTDAQWATRLSTPYFNAGTLIAYTPPPPPPPVPQVVTMYQAQYTLYSRPSNITAGKTLLDDANAIIALGSFVDQLAWAKATTLNRPSPIVLRLGTALGLNATDLDNLFIAASKVTA